MGPAALRIAGIGALLCELGFAVHDHGDLAIPLDAGAHPAASSHGCNNFEAVAAWTRAIHERAGDLLSTGAIPVFLGGDHSLSMGTVSAVARHCGEMGRELAVLWIDAHADFNTPDTSPPATCTACRCPFSPAIPVFSPAGRRRADTSSSRGGPPVRAGSIDQAERRRVRDSGMNSIDMRAIDEFGVAALMRGLIERWTGRDIHLHVSLDLDFLDPALAPGVGTVVPGGATYREAHLVMEMLADTGLVGSVDVVELNPFLDERGRSARLLAELIASLFGRTVLERRPA